jgi:hypothetical protein
MYFFHGHFHLQRYLTTLISILVAAGHSADLWAVRGMAIGGTWPLAPFFSEFQLELR